MMATTYRPVPWLAFDEAAESLDSVSAAEAELVATLDCLLDVKALTAEASSSVLSAVRPLPRPPALPAWTVREAPTAEEAAWATLLIHSAVRESASTPAGWDGRR